MDQCVACSASATRAGMRILFPLRIGHDISFIKTLLIGYNYANCTTKFAGVTNRFSETNEHLIVKFRKLIILNLNMVLPLHGKFYVGTLPNRFSLFLVVVLCYSIYLISMKKK